MSRNTLTIRLEDGGRGPGPGKGPPPLPKPAQPPPLPKIAKPHAPEDLGQTALNSLGFGGVGNALKGASAGLGTAAGVAGIIGLVAMGAQTATNALNQLGKRANEVSELFQSIAMGGTPSTLGTSDKFADYLSDTIPILGDVAAAQVRLQGAIIEMPEKLTNAFIQRAGQIGQYSPQISMSQAQAQARNTMADLREAQMLGPSMARMIEAQNRTDLAFRELVLPIKKVVVELLADRLELFARVAEKLVKWLDIQMDANDRDMFNAFFDTAEKQFG